MYGFSAPGLGGVRGGLFGFGSSLLSGPPLLPPITNIPLLGGLHSLYAFGGPGLLGLGGGLFGPGGPPDPFGLRFEISFIQSLIGLLYPGEPEPPKLNFPAWPYDYPNRLGEPPVEEFPDNPIQTIIFPKCFWGCNCCGGY